MGLAGISTELRPLIQGIPCSVETWDSCRLPLRFFLEGFVIILKVEVWFELWIWIWETFLSEITRWVTIQTFCGFTDIVLTYFKTLFSSDFTVGTKILTPLWLRLYGTVHAIKHRVWSICGHFEYLSNFGVIPKGWRTSIMVTDVGMCRWHVPHVGDGFGYFGHQHPLFLNISVRFQDLVTILPTPK